jgi:uncharacterized iron-regulated membrane protein
MLTTIIQILIVILLVLTIVFIVTFVVLWLRQAPKSKARHDAMVAEHDNRFREAQEWIDGKRMKH